MGDDLGRVAFILCALKRERVPFDDAWLAAFPPSRPHPDRAALRYALDATQDAWRRAFDDAPPTAGERAAASIAALWNAEDDGAELGASAYVGVRCG